MKCQRCGIEMSLVKAGVWQCRNPKCLNYPKKEEKENGK